MLLCLALGVGLEVWVSYAGHGREAWDTGIYWAVGLPAAALAAAVVGYLTTGNGWMAPGLIIPGQMLAMIYRSGSNLGLWPLTIVLAFGLSLPFVLVSWIASRFRRER